MEGPTPISALIHAATMVTAGIFMVARMSPLYELSATALNVILIVGAITALFMGFLGIIQNDIKRVVAYSTLSQLGYMTVALGASAYSVAVFHLMTHAFFKALLFLAAGSVIMGLHHNQDIRWMGGVRKYMPITWITCLLGSLALIVLWLLFQRQHHPGGAGEQLASQRLCRLCGGRGCLCDGLLFFPHVLPGLPWQGALRPGSA
jgi:NADH-quinone oxidoreductase subunit L